MTGILILCGLAVFMVAANYVDDLYRQSQIRRDREYTERLMDELRAKHGED